MKYFANIQTAEELKKAFRTLCTTLHPDKGGDAQTFAEMLNEYETKLKGFGAYTKEDRQKVAGLRRGVVVVFVGAGCINTRYIITSINAEFVEMVRLFSHDFASLEDVEYFDKDDDRTSREKKVTQYTHIDPLSEKFGIGYYWDDLSGKTYTDEEIKEAERVADNFDKWIKAKEEAEAEAERKAQEEADKAEAAIIAEWSQILEQLPPRHKSKGWQELEALPRSERKAQKEADKKAERKANAQRLAAFKRNIKAVFNHYFPGVKISVSDSSKCWCESSVISWVDGPTVAEVEAVEAFDYFRACGWAAPTPYEDYGHRTTRRTLSKFRELFGAWSDETIKFERTMSEEKTAEIRAQVLKVCPQFEGVADGQSVTVKDEGENAVYYDLLNIIGLELPKIDEATATEEEKEKYNTISKGRDNLRRFVGYGSGGSGVKISFDVLKHYANKYKVFETSQPKTESKPKTKPEPQTESEPTATATPAEGLQLVEIVGGVAVVGDAKATYKARKEIKAHGAKWNRTASRWEATEPEAVESLRQWFAMSEPQTEPTAEPETEPTAQDAPQSDNEPTADNATTETESEPQSEPTAEPQTEPTADDHSAEAFAAFVDALQQFSSVWGMCAEVQTEPNDDNGGRFTIRFAPEDCPELDEIPTNPEAEAPTGAAVEDVENINTQRQPLTAEEAAKVRRVFTRYAETVETLTDDNEHTAAIFAQAEALLFVVSSSDVLIINNLMNELNDINKKHDKRGHILPEEIARREEIAGQFAALSLASFGHELTALLFGEYQTQQAEKATANKAA